MAVKIEFETTGAAFQEGRELEVANILAHVTEMVSFGHTGGVIRDSWGNEVGAYSVVIPTHEPDEDDPAWNDEDGGYRFKWLESEQMWHYAHEVKWDEEKGDYVRLEPLVKSYVKKTSEPEIVPCTRCGRFLCDD